MKAKQRPEKTPPTLAAGPHGVEPRTRNNNNTHNNTAENITEVPTAGRAKSAHELSIHPRQNGFKPSEKKTESSQTAPSISNMPKRTNTEILKRRRRNREKGAVAVPQIHGDQRAAGLAVVSASCPFCRNTARGKCEAPLSSPLALNKIVTALRGPLSICLRDSHGL